MADIFISYARSTAPQAQRIAEALRALGYGVWRDDELPAHRAYAEVIEERLKAAKAVVVIWSAEGVRSEWVQSEADRARGDRKLVQLTVDGTALPMPFDRIQCADLTAWSGDLTAPGWRKVVASIADLMGGAAPAKAPEAQGERVGLSICVLPFANMSDDREQEYFADGISEDIITDLSKVSALAVISRNSAFTFKGRHVDLPAVARTLKVSHVLEGSVRRSGNRVRITAQLINGTTNDHVWAERYDRDLSDIFALQDEISQAIVKALKVKLFPQEKQAIEDRGTSNVEAYDKYLRARALFNRSGPEDLERAAELFGQALALDAKFSRARAGFVQAQAFSLIYAPHRTARAIKALEEAVSEGRAHAPDDWSTHLASAFLHLQRYERAEAERSFERAAELAAGFVAEIVEGSMLLYLAVGRLEETLSFLQASASTDPLSAHRSFQVQYALGMLGRTSEAEAEYQRSKDLPGADAREDMPHWALMRIWNGGDSALIEDRFDAFLSRQTIPSPWIAKVRAVYDDPAAALEVIRGAFQDPANQDSTRLHFVTCYAAHYGDTELALAGLRRALVEMRGILLQSLWYADLAEVRRTPAFRQIVRDVGLYDYWRASGKWGDFARPKGDDDFEIVR